KLQERFGLDEVQSQAIVDMRLRALTGLERERLQEEYAELEKAIEDFRAILSDENRLLTVIRDEISEIGQKYGDDRRTQIGQDEDEIIDEDLIPDDDNVIAMTGLGYIKRMSPDNFRAQNRGGKGIRGMQVLDDDYTTQLQTAKAKDNILFFTNRGRAYMMKVYEIPESSRTSRGTPIINLLSLMPDEKVTAMVAQRDIDHDSMILMATRNGTVKKTRAYEYRNVRKNGLIAITLRDDDELIGVKNTDGHSNVLLVSEKGNSIFFNEEDIRLCGRASIGVRGMKLRPGDRVVSMETEEEGKTVLFVSENGIGKRTAFSEFTLQNRGGQGSRGYRITDKTGLLVGTMLVSEGDEIMLITTEGIIIRTTVDTIPVLSRTSSGVKLMNVGKDNGEKVSSFTVMQKNEDDTLTEEGTDPEENEEDQAEDTTE
ncbi:MAG: DNA gyrase subunit A, partial [Lachnospiraceae bacterium]|nr:DNA gyrase subunit A [Lachnospiraceae bacterium]